MITAPQQETFTGMLKWNIHFEDGRTCTMLSSAARTPEAAFASAASRFGPKVVKVT